MVGSQAIHSTRRKRKNQKLKESIGDLRKQLAKAIEGADYAEATALDGFQAREKEVVKAEQAVAFRMEQTAIAFLKAQESAKGLDQREDALRAAEIQAQVQKDLKSDSLYQIGEENEALQREVEASREAIAILRNEADLSAKHLSELQNRVHMAQNASLFKRLWAALIRRQLDL